jgi:hypothetical protein
MKYLVALKREARGRAPSGWQQKLASLPGVQAESGLGTDRVHIEATDEGVERARRTLGEFLHIEPIVYRQALRSE